MTLVIAFIAAVVATVVWYVKAPDNTYRIGTLALMFWAAALMWCVDGVFCLMEGEPFIEIFDTAAMLDDAVLGLVVVAVGLGAWALYLLLRDPKNVFAKLLGSHN
jgi:hypothetical protein